MCQSHLSPVAFYYTFLRSYFSPIFILHIHIHAPCISSIITIITIIISNSIHPSIHITFHSFSLYLYLAFSFLLLLSLYRRRSQKRKRKKRRRRGIKQSSIIHHLPCFIQLIHTTLLKVSLVDFKFWVWFNFVSLCSGFALVLLGL